jgi:hypothetical protein
MFVLSCIAPFVDTGALAESDARGVPAVDCRASQSLIARRRMFEMQWFERLHASDAELRGPFSSARPAVSSRNLPPDRAKTRQPAYHFIINISVFN